MIIPNYYNSLSKSYIRSASSSTTIVTLFNEMSFPACMHKISIIRPGVHTTISEPRLRSAICSATPAPPMFNKQQ
jgi:hypothetical protein